MPSLAPPLLCLLLRLTLTTWLVTALVSSPALAQTARPGLLASPAPSAIVSTDQVRAELLVHAPQGITPGQPVWLGLQLLHQPDWHTYWKNPGDSGLPTELQWTLPAGVSAGEIAWPTPRKIPLGNLANYGYEGSLLLPVPLTVAADFKSDQLEVRLKASWLVCRKECIPREGEFWLKVPVRGSLAMHGRAFDTALAARPRDWPAGQGQVEVRDKTIRVSLHGLPTSLQGKALSFFPETGNVIEPAGRWQQSWQGTVWTAEVPLSAQRSESPARMPLVVALESAASGVATPAFRLDAPVKGNWPALPAAATVSPALVAALKANAGAKPQAPSGTDALTLLVTVFGALLGGLILNLMPCVFPVLAIKMVGFVQVKSRASRIRSGLAYTAGVVLSFLALGALLLALRATGEQLGWGFQLQSPALVAGLAALFTLLGLNLAGMFEFGQLLPSALANAQSRNPTVNAFLSGVLAAAIASPCTAPFMGASLGLAVSLPPVQALLVFGAMGLGMALPYALASAVPAVAHAMPRPGPWMRHFKQLMAFPMFATVAWLVWVLGQQSGIDGAGALLGLLVLLALLAWSFTLAGRLRTVAVSVTLALGGWALWEVGPQWVNPPELGSAATANAGDLWQPWQPGRVAQLLTSGQPVFVDFTAAWCVTCQYNKKTTLANAQVLSDVKNKNVALLRADWTRRDPAVTAALGELGRSGVPVYVIYQPGKSPVVLSEILTVGDVRQALSKL